VVCGALIRSKRILLLMLCGIGACEPKAPDVLQEFPPPRLAKVSPNVEMRALSMTAECAAELSMQTRSTSKTLHLSGARGTFELPASGKLDMNAELSVSLPGDISDGSTGSRRPLVWRLLEVHPRVKDNGLSTRTESTAASSMQVVAEFEYNRVRTQVVHLLEFENPDHPSAPPTKVHLSRLSLDPSAHRLQFPATAYPPGGRPTSNAGSQLKRVELTFHCGLREIDRSHP
jgi:hypothetical protein